MIHPIVRMYATAQQATEALNKLMTWGFKESETTLITPSSFASPASTDAVVAAISAGHVLTYYAKILAKGVSSGHSLVIVRAPFGTGGHAVEILERYAPVDSGLPKDNDLGLSWDDAAPFSSALHLPALSKAGASPFSEFWSLPTGSGKSWTLSSLLGLPELTSSGAPTTSGLGLPLLSHKAAPFSSLFGLPLLR